ncbi:MAG: site-specific DNA-methyltransferase, partial [Bryobacteraceae bacterium]
MYEVKPNNIYNVDCLEGMKLITDGTIDMILCDLPYGTTSCA